MGVKMFYDHHFIGVHLIWWIGVGLITLLIVFNLLASRSSSHTREDPLDILKKRFARGEIEREEYQERKLVIENDQNR